MGFRVGIRFPSKGKPEPLIPKSETPNPDRFIAVCLGVVAILRVEFPKIRGTVFWGPYNKDPTIKGTIFGSPIFGNSQVSATGCSCWLPSQIRRC